MSRIRAEIDRSRAEIRLALMEAQLQTQRFGVPHARHHHGGATKRQILQQRRRCIAVPVLLVPMPGGDESSQRLVQSAVSRRRAPVAVPIFLVQLPGLQGTAAATPQEGHAAASAAVQTQAVSDAPPYAAPSAPPPDVMASMWHDIVGLLRDTILTDRALQAPSAAESGSNIGNAGAAAPVSPGGSSQLSATALPTGSAEVVDSSLVAARRGFEAAATTMASDIRSAMEANTAAVVSAVQTRSERQIVDDGVSSALISAGVEDTARKVLAQMQPLFEHLTQEINELKQSTRVVRSNSSDSAGASPLTPAEPVGTPAAVAAVTSTWDALELPPPPEPSQAQLAIESAAAAVTPLDAGVTSGDGPALSDNKKTPTGAGATPGEAAISFSSLSQLLLQRLDALTQEVSSLKQQQEHLLAHQQQLHAANEAAAAAAVIVSPASVASRPSLQSDATHGEVVSGDSRSSGEARERESPSSRLRSISSPGAVPATLSPGQVADSSGVPWPTLRGSLGLATAVGRQTLPSSSSSRLWLETPASKSGRSSSRRASGVGTGPAQTATGALASTATLAILSVPPHTPAGDGSGSSADVRITPDSAVSEGMAGWVREEGVEDTAGETAAADGCSGAVSRRGSHGGDHGDAMPQPAF